MSVTLNASTSAGFIQTADTSGTIELQNNGTTKLTVNSSGVNIGQYNPSASLITSGTSVASTSGTSIDFTSIPSWVKRVTVTFGGVSTNGSSPLLLQIGDSGGVENTGYEGMSGLMHSSGANTYTGVTAGIPLGYSTMSAATTYNGDLTITNLTGNQWTITGTLATSSLLYLMVFGGVKTLSATLDRVRITTVNGTDTFDAGTINILYE